MSNGMWRPFSITWLAWACVSVSAGVSGPVSGYVFDEAVGQVRPILGLPGGAVLGAPVVLPFTLKRAVVASSGFLVGVAPSGQVVVVTTLDGAEPAITPIDQVDANPDQVVLNQSATAVVLSWRDSAKVQVIRGLPGNPEVSAAMDLSQLPGDVLAVATDSTGADLLVGVSRQGSGGVYLVRVSRDSVAVKFLGPAVRPVAVQFLHAGRDAVIADQGANQVFLIKDVAGAAEQRILASAIDGLHAPAMLAASEDKDYVLAGNADGDHLFVVSLQNDFASTVQAVDLPGAATQLTRLAGPHLYLLSQVSSSPQYVFDNSQQPRTYFVPADRPRAGSTTPTMARKRRSEVSACRLALAGCSASQ